jgi:hypothetical protein
MMHGLPIIKTVIIVHRFSWKVLIILARFQRKLDFLKNLEKYSTNNFYENPSKEGRILPCGQTNRHVGANSRFSIFCGSA